MLKKGVNATTETSLVWSLNSWISCAWSILSKGPPPPPPPPPSLIFMASLPRYSKTYLLCTISLEYSATMKKPLRILRSHQKSSLRPFLHRALQLCFLATGLSQNSYTISDPECQNFQECFSKWKETGLKCHKISLLPRGRKGWGTILHIYIQEYTAEQGMVFGCTWSGRG